MDVLTFIAEALKAIVWPITILILAQLFRRDLAALLSRISALKHKDTELSFGQELSKAADKLTESHHDGLESLSTPEAKKSLAILDISPSAAVLSAWVDFEMAAREVAGALHQGIRAPTIKDYLRQLAKHGLIDDDDMEFLYLLRELRNRVAHSPSSELDKETASKVVEVLHQLAWEIRNPDKVAKLRERKK